MERILEEDIFITETSQPASWATLSDAGKDLTIDSETEENINLMLTICDNLNELFEKLSKLNYLMGRKIIEYNLNQKNKGE
ncbi:hypothetical protein R84B8_00336 [Treponema sp. R8-4-B8]